VVVAGVTMNFLLAVIAFYLFLSLVGFKVLIPRLADYQFKSPNATYVAVTYVQKDSPADKVGLVPGDVLAATDGQQFGRMSDFQNYIKAHAETPVRLTVADINLTKTREITVTPRANPPPGEGALGVGIGEAVALRYTTFQQKILSGLSYAWDMLVYNLKVLSHLATQSFQTRNVAPLSESVSGPVGIAGAVGTILDLGGSQAVIQLINLLGLLSLSLAFLNIMPFPALDGGRLAFLLVEALTRKKVAAKYENWVNQAGMVMLLCLIVLVSFSDLSKIISPLLPR
jgi:regulator of sigma E protease